MNSIERLQDLIHDQFDVEKSKIDPDAPFATYDIDSLTLAELIFTIEDDFHVNVPDSAATSVSTLRGLAQLLDELLSSTPAAPQAA
ncbi:phosphopantetheine-binding protein [Paucibacter sp. R3-3]|uniref:Phosphopantetheine-binding protein n=1 Tax=Roseateles agri TaxID=3098619 RepID=A0ABU5DJ50_9BURK|nr:phosphopantetheine-binding protein [Paucibacter sp. R3-3]MDY0745816.1 phosphopantetheine-binding protein [Paucibacter sp. R3-3]